jgi:hypothetical protein
MSTPWEEPPLDLELEEMTKHQDERVTGLLRLRLAREKDQARKAKYEPPPKDVA